MSLFHLPGGNTSIQSKLLCTSLFYPVIVCPLCKALLCPQWVEVSWDSEEAGLQRRLFSFCIDFGLDPLHMPCLSRSPRSYHMGYPCLFLCNLYRRPVWASYAPVSLNPFCCQQQQKAIAKLLLTYNGHFMSARNKVFSRLTTKLITILILWSILNNTPTGGKNGIMCIAQLQWKGIIKIIIIKDRGKMMK